MTIISLNIKMFTLAFKRLMRENYIYSTSALAYNTLLALVPLLSVIFYFIQIFPFFRKLTLVTRDYIVSNFIPTSSDIIQTYLYDFIQHAAKLPTLGFVFLIFTSVFLIVTVEHTLSKTMHATRKHKGVSWLILYWIIVIFAPLLIGMVVVVSTYVFSFSGLTEFPLLVAWPLVINSSMFSVLFMVISHSHLKWGDVIFGGVITAILLDFAKIMFGTYLRHFPSYELIYGALATIPVFLIWIYISWLIVIFGALCAHSRCEIRCKISKHS